MKLLVITPYFYPDPGGVANHTYNLYKRMANKKTEIVIVTSGENKEIQIERLDGMKIYRLPIHFKISNTPINFRWKSMIKGILRKEKPIAIMAHTPVPYISDVAFKVKGKIPFILKYHHAGSMKKGRFFMDLLVRLYESLFLQKLFRSSDKIIVSSDFTRNTFLKKYWKNVATITPGVDTNLFKPKKTNVKNKVLFVANLKKSEKYKGLNYLLEAIAIVKKQLPKIKLTVVGEGNYMKHYETQCTNLGIRKHVEFKGKLIGKDLVKEYQHTNVLVLPSLFESFGMVLIEAMACKKPVIGTNICGIPLVVKNNREGILIHSKSPRKIAKSIIRLIQIPKLAKRLGKNGYKKVIDNFSWDTKSKETLELIEEVINQ